jgi:male germ cell-associated kinase
MENYRITKNIGDGGFGFVSQAVVKSTGEVVAIKKLKQKFYSWDECLELREIKVLRKVIHPNIVKLKEVIRVNDELYLVFEYCEKNLFDIINDKQDIEEGYIREVIRDTLLGLLELHRNGFYHRDIKPENLLISNSACKLADLGLAKEIRSPGNCTDYVSTRWYRAPEVILRSRKYSWQVDIFAVGCIMAELYLRSPLFPGTSEIDQLNKYCNVLGSPDSWAEGMRLAACINFYFPSSPGIPLGQIIPRASAEAVELLSILLVWDPRMRPNADVCLQQPFFHKRNFSNSKVPHLESKKNSALTHSSSSSTLSRTLKPQNPIRTEGLKKIGANLILNGNLRNKY